MVFRFYDMNHVFLGLIDSDFIKDLVIEEKLENGYKTMSFSIASSKADFLCEEGYLQTIEDEFIVKELNKENNDYYFVQCKANIESLEKTIVQNFESLTKKAWEIANLALLHTGWTVQNDISQGAPAYTKDRTIRVANGTVLDVIKNIRTVFMIDVWFDSKNKVVHLTENRGEDKGFVLANEINMKNFSLQSNTYDYITRIYPYGKDNLSIASINDGIPYVENHTYSDKVLSLVWIDQRYTVAESLKADAIEKLAELAIPKRSYSCKVSAINKDNLKIGDTITFIDSYKKIREKQRITSVTNYPLTPENNSITIANTNLSFAQKQEQMDKVATIVENNTNDAGVITGGSGGGGGEYPDVATFTSVTTSQLNAVNIDTNDIDADTSSIGDLQATTIEAGTIHATTGSFDNFDFGQVVATDLEVENLSVTGDFDFVNGVGNGLQVNTIVNHGQYTGYLTADNFQAGAITSDKITISDGYITSVMIGDAQISAAKIADGAITNAKIVSLDAAKITSGTIETERLIIVGDDHSIVYEINLANGSPELSQSTIDGSSITDRTITSRNIVAETITGNEIAGRTITTDKLVAGAVTTTELGAQSVTTEKLAAGAITADKIRANSITLGQLSEDVLNFINSLNPESEAYTDAAIAALRAEIEQFLNFNASTGLIIGSPQSEVLLQLLNDRISFKKSGVEVAYISNDRLYITNAEILNRLKIGHYVWVPRHNGNLSLIWED